MNCEHFCTVKKENYDKNFESDSSQFSEYFANYNFFTVNTTNSFSNINAETLADAKRNIKNPLKAYL